MASTDRGNTSYAGPSGDQVNSTGDLATPDQSRGTYGAGSSTPAFTTRDRGETFDLYATFGLPTPVTGSGATVYKMTGYYVAGSTYESWTAGTPDTSPPSGHALTFISYVVLQGGDAN